ncbi:MAG: hypothetical protein COA74_11750 [Gammaproteobacteria bacterium]|nr:MAG: hypothetical protein COA74_11750 [Gammaproteobacteria bacterium]
MHKYFLPFLLFNVLSAGTAMAECNGTITERNIFLNQEIYKNTLIIKLPRIEDGLELSDVGLSVKAYDGTEEIHPVKVPYWVELYKNYWVYDIPDKLQTLSVHATYSDGCNSVHTTQQLQDEIASLNHKKIMIKWIGKDFHYLISGCFGATQADQREAL